MSDLIKKFIKNAKDFTEAYAIPGSEYIQNVETGQSAKVLLIGCSDSLVDPAKILGAEPNEIFVHRNISAIVPSFKDQKIGSPNGTAAVLDFAVNFLKVSDIIILGHGHCGGMKALDQGLSRETTDQDFIMPWVTQVQNAHKTLLENGTDPEDPNFGRLLEKQAAIQSLKHLKTYPWIAERLKSQDLTLHAWHFDRGTLSTFDEETGTFQIKVQKDPSS